tara:strand:+ start:50 stop:631 length:582 start_codon:yes stop_codon:yes gene_type:complete
MSDLTITHSGVAVTANSAGSSISTGRRKIIRVTPTLDTSAYAVGDVLFNSVEIPNAVKEDGGCSKLTGMYILNQNLTDTDLDFIFSENSMTLGTQNATANISDPNIEAANVTGFLHLDSGAATTSQLDNSEIKRVTDAGHSGADSANAHAQPATPILLQAAEGSTSVYVAAIVVAGTPTLAADDIDLIFHIEY